jgi:hypothetical protein
MSDVIETTFEFEGNTFPLVILTGVVIDTETRSDTHVYGGGSYGSGNNVQVSSVKSYVEVTKDVWLRFASGDEKRYKFGDFAVRPGHILQVAALHGGMMRTENLTTGGGYKHNVSSWSGATTADGKVVTLCPHHSSAENFYFVKCSLVASVFGSFLAMFASSNSGRSSTTEQFIVMTVGVIAFIYLVVVIVGFLYRRNPSSRKNLNQPLNNAAIAKFEGMKAERAEAVEQLKASLAGTETAIISGTAS